MLVSFPLAFLVIRTIKETNYDDEKVVFVDDVKKGEMERGEVEEGSEKESIKETAASIQPALPHNSTL